METLYLFHFPFDAIFFWLVIFIFCLLGLRRNYYRILKRPSDICHPNCHVFPAMFDGKYLSNLKDLIHAGGILTCEAVIDCLPRSQKFFLQIANAQEGIFVERSV